MVLALGHKAGAAEIFCDRSRIKYTLPNRGDTNAWPDIANEAVVYVSDGAPERRSAGAPERRSAGKPGQRDTGSSEAPQNVKTVRALGFGALEWPHTRAQGREESCQVHWHHS